MNEIGICSISPFERHWERSYGRFRIKPGTIEKPSYLWIADAKDQYWTDMEKKEGILVDIKAQTICDDLVSFEERKEGFFLIKGDKPTEQELSDAIAAQKEWYIGQVKLGDASWAQHGKHEHISDTQRRAAVALGVERDWAGIVKPRIDCPACGEMVPAHVALCKFCSAVINKEAFDKLEFATQGARPAAYERLSEGKEV